MENTNNQELAREIQAILYPEVTSNLETKDNVKELYQKHLYYNRRHNLRTSAFAYKALLDPAMAVMLRHFYEKEITKPNKIDEFTLGLSLENAFFNDFKIVNS